MSYDELTENDILDFNDISRTDKIVRKVKQSKPIKMTKKTFKVFKEKTGLLSKEARRDRKIDKYNEKFEALRETLSEAGEKSDRRVVRKAELLIAQLDELHAKIEVLDLKIEKANQLKEAKALKVKSKMLANILANASLVHDFIVGHKKPSGKHELPNREAFLNRNKEAYTELDGVEEQLLSAMDKGNYDKARELGEAYNRHAAQETPSTQPTQDTPSAQPQTETQASSTESQDEPQVVDLNLGGNGEDSLTSPAESQTEPVVEAQPVETAQTDAPAPQTRGTGEMEDVFSGAPLDPRVVTRGTDESFGSFYRTREQRRNSQNETSSSQPQTETQASSTESQDEPQVVDLNLGGNGEASLTPPAESQTEPVVEAQSVETAQTDASHIDQTVETQTEPVVESQTNESEPVQTTTPQESQDEYEQVTLEEYIQENEPKSQEVQAITPDKEILREIIDSVPSQKPSFTTGFEEVDETYTQAVDSNESKPIEASTSYTGLSLSEIEEEIRAAKAAKEAAAAREEALQSEFARRNHEAVSLFHTAGEDFHQSGYDYSVKEVNKKKEAMRELLKAREELVALNATTAVESIDQATESIMSTVGMGGSIVREELGLTDSGAKKR